MSDKKTVLYDEHDKLGAKLAPFGGYIMPIQYTGVIEEHLACRENVAVFDTCHMGEFFFEGEKATDDLENILTCNVESLPIGKCRYGFICNEKGTTIDDMIIYRLNDNSYMMVVNSGTQDNDFEWITSKLSPSTKATNKSDETAKIDIQGPNAAKLTNQLLENSINDLTFYSFKNNTYKDTDVIVSRTGYTGEIGFEIYLPRTLAKILWNEAISLGAIAAGLGARDTLRLEMGMPLYGHELSTKLNPAESGFTRAIDNGKTFIGSDTVLDSSKSPRILKGIILDGRQKPRDGEDITNNSGDIIGTITSGGYSPSLGCGIALAYINRDTFNDNMEIKIPRKRKDLLGKALNAPLYKNATGRKKLDQFI